MRKLIFVILLLNFVFLQAKIIEKKGNSSIKKMTQPQANTYIGISQPLPSLQSAIDNAVSHAQNQIIQNLGVKAQIDIQFEDYQYSVNHSENSQTTFIKRSNISGTYSLKIKADQFYWEHHKTKKDEYYLVFVVVIFSKNEYIKHIENTYEIMSDKIAQSLSHSAPERVLQEMLRLKAVLKEFNTDYQHLSQLISKEVEGEYIMEQERYGEKLEEFTRHLKIERINKDERFPNQIYVYITYHDQPFKHFPMNIKTHYTYQIPTDDEGFILIQPDYTRFIRQDCEISFSSNQSKDTQLPVDQFTLLSPLYNQNITIQLDVKTEQYSDELMDDILNHLHRKQFKVINSEISTSDPKSKMADYILKVVIKSVYQAKQSKVNHYVYETQMQIQLINAKNSIVDEWHYPNREFSDMVFVSDRQLKAKHQSISLSNYPKKNELWQSLMVQIEQAIKRKNVKAE